jgi:hypothetical protein
LERRQWDGFRLNITAVRFRNQVNIGGFAGWLVAAGVKVEKAPVKWAFSQKA